MGIFKTYLGAIVFFVIGLSVSIILAATAGLSAALICAAITAIITMLLMVRVVMHIRREIAAFHDGSLRTLWGDDRIKRDTATSNIPPGEDTGLRRL